MVLAAKANKASKPKAVAGPNNQRSNRQKALPKKRDEVLEKIGAVETRLEALNATYCGPGFFERTPPDEVGQLRKERETLEAELTSLTSEWESLEAELAALV